MGEPRGQGGWGSLGVKRIIAHQVVGVPVRGVLPCAHIYGYGEGGHGGTSMDMGRGDMGTNEGKGNGIIISHHAVVFMDRIMCTSHHVDHAKPNHTHKSQ